MASDFFEGNLKEKNEPTTPENQIAWEEYIGRKSVVLILIFARLQSFLQMDFASDRCVAECLLLEYQYQWQNNRHTNYQLLQPNITDANHTQTSAIIIQSRMIQPVPF